MYQMTWTKNHDHQTCHQIKINAIRRKSVVNTKKMTRQTNFRATILIRPTTVNADTSGVREKAFGYKTDQIVRTFNGKVADNRV